MRLTGCRSAAFAAMVYVSVAAAGTPVRAADFNVDNVSDLIGVQLMCMVEVTFASGHVHLEVTEGPVCFPGDFAEWNYNMTPLAGLGGALPVFIVPGYTDFDGDLVTGVTYTPFLEEVIFDDMDYSYWMNTGYQVIPSLELAYPSGVIDMVVDNDSEVTSIPYEGGSGGEEEEGYPY